MEIAKRALVEHLDASHRQQEIEAPAAFLDAEAWRTTSLQALP
jgi:hypothetical protein